MAPPTHLPALDALLWAALGLYAAAIVAVLLRPAWGRPPLLLGAGLHLAALAGRGFAVGTFPLSNKMESFAGFSLAGAAVLAAAWRPSRPYVLPQLVAVLAALAFALSLGTELAWPFGLLITPWYPLHVPLSFLSYALWLAAASAGLAWAASGGDEAWIERLDRLALQGFALWSASMVFGGIWGVVAWGATFLWDPKILWSVILWLHYASLLHLRWTGPGAVRPGLRAALAGLGALWVLVAYVGTSFFFGASSHAF